MVIQNSDTYHNNSIAFWPVFVGLVIMFAARPCFAEQRGPVEVLAASYHRDVTNGPEGARALVAELENALKECRDPYLAFRLRYRIALTYFKAQMMESATAGFKQMVKEPNCPGLVRICSFNMIGQICRMEGENAEALEAFARVADSVEHGFFSDGQGAGEANLIELVCSSLFSRAEIYEMRGDYEAGAREYKRLIDILKREQSEDRLHRYAALAADRISQLYLRQGLIERYLKIAERLRVDYPQYHRTPLVELEVECVRFLRSSDADFDSSRGSFAVPAQATGYVRTADSNAGGRELANKLDSMCSKCKESYGAILLRYHYAWLSDALGQKNKACQILDGIFTADTAEGSGYLAEVVNTVRSYAGIQLTIMLAEEGHYKEASNTLRGLGEQPENSHLAELSKSVRKATEVLKREVPESESDRK